MNCPLCSQPTDPIHAEKDIKAQQTYDGGRKGIWAQIPTVVVECNQASPYWTTVVKGLLNERSA